MADHQRYDSAWRLFIPLGAVRAPKCAHHEMGSAAECPQWPPGLDAFGRKASVGERGGGGIGTRRAHQYQFQRYDFHFMRLSHYFHTKSTQTMQIVTLDISKRN